MSLTAVEELQRDLKALSARMDRMEMSFSMERDRFEGQRVRIERILGTVNDLLTRFEGWKKVGNDLGADVERLHQSDALHSRMWEEQQQANTLVQAFMLEVKSKLQSQLQDNLATTGEGEGR